MGGLTPPIASPCTGICRIAPTDGLCDGCGRDLDEIMRWGTMTVGERDRVMRALPDRIVSRLA